MLEVDRQRELQINLVCVDRGKSAVFSPFQMSHEIPIPMLVQ